jgi:hypothetical protein
MFRKNLTKWSVLITYNQSGSDYIVFFRKNKKTGMMYFKVKRVGYPFVCSYHFTKSMVDIQKQFDEMLLL